MNGVEVKDDYTKEAPAASATPPNPDPVIGPAILAFAEQRAAKTGTPTKLNAEKMPSDAELERIAEWFTVTGSVLERLDGQDLTKSILAVSEDARAFVAQDPENAKHLAAFAKATVDYHRKLEQLAGVEDHAALNKRIGEIQEAAKPKPWYKRWACKAWTAITWLKWARNTGETVHGAVTIMNSPAFQVAMTGMKLLLTFAI